MARIGRYLAALGAIGIIAVGAATVRKVMGYELTYLPTDRCVWFYSLDSQDLEPDDRVGILVDTNDPDIGNVVNKVGKICIGRYIISDPNVYGFLDAYGNDTSNDDMWVDKNGNDVVDTNTPDPNDEELIMDYGWEDMNENGMIELDEFTMEGNGIYDIFKDGAFDYEPLEWRIWKSYEMREYYAETEPNMVLYDPADEWMHVRVDLRKGELVPQPCGGWDLDGDGGVGFGDYAIFADTWLDSCGPYNGWCGLCDGGIEGSGLGSRDGIVDSFDLAGFTGHWLEECQE